MLINRFDTCTDTQAELINRVFDTLKAYYGHFDWWHKDKPYEVMLGAVLVQNTNWKNAEKALDNIGEELHPQKIDRMPEQQLAELIRPSGYYNQKAKKLKALTQWFKQYHYDIERVRKVGKERLRAELLEIKGVGRETADAILVYAIRKPSFVIDTYTRRIFSRNGLDVPKDYDKFRGLIEQALPEDNELYAYYHGLMVDHAQQFCNKTPKCTGCPLRSSCLEADA